MQGGERLEVLLEGGRAKPRGTDSGGSGVGHPQVVPQKASWLPGKKGISKEAGGGASLQVQHLSGKDDSH